MAERRVTFGPSSRSVDPDLLAAMDAATAPKAEGPHPRSLFGQFSDVVKGLPGGLVGLAKDAVVTAVAPVRIGIDLAQGDAVGGAEAWEHYGPLFGKTAESFGRTGGRLVDLGASLAPGGEKPSESQYGQAVSEGRIVGAVLEDLGNVALVGGAAAKAAGAGAARATATAAAATERAAVAASAGDAALAASE